jgi:ubiquinone/menaquinone biosynthesis C-methylase UbiE
MLDYYRRFDESQRLRGADDVEYVRTQDIFARYLPPAQAVILDVGGATGAYALPLAAHGYEVHLIDPVAHHVEEAARRSATAPRPLASCAVGDARALPFPGGFADGVVMLGPLYHLTSRTDRRRALDEARRVLRDGGRLFGAAISRFASLLDGLQRDLIADPAFVEIVKRDLRDGRHTTTGDPRYFTDSYFHLPDELRTEVLEAGFTVDALVGIEGPIWDSARIPGWKDPERRALILELLRRVEQEPALLGASAHIMIVATR